MNGKTSGVTQSILSSAIKVIGKQHKEILLGFIDLNEYVSPCFVTLLCSSVSKFKTMVRMKIETAADLTDPPTNTQILQKVKFFLFPFFLKI